MAALIDGYKEAIVAGRPILVNEPVPETNLATFPGKTVLGDYSIDNNPLLSSWVGSDFTGGHGVEDMNESLDVNRYRLGTFYTRFPGQITKRYASYNSTSTSGVVNLYAMEDMKLNGDWWASIFYHQVSPVSRAIFFYNQAGTWTTTPAPTSVPVGTAVVYRGTAAYDYLVIPTGASGYITVEGSTTYPTPLPLVNVAPVAPVANIGKPALQACVLWDYKLVGIDVDGQLWYTTDPTGDWTSYGDFGKLPASSEVRSLVNFFDKSNNPTIFVVTDTDVWQFDANGPQLATVDVFFPPHPYHGLAAERWSGDLYFSVGTGVHRYTGGVLAGMGLDRDHGLPIEYNGYIVAGGLVGGYNALYAFVTAPENLDDYVWSGTQPDPVSSIHEYSGGGWHMIWSSDAEYIVPNSMRISRASFLTDVQYSLVWGIIAQDGSYSSVKQITLPVNFTNPRQLSRTIGGYHADGWMETGIFDAGMKAYKKTANAIDILISQIADDATFTVKYKIDSACGNADEEWTTLAAFTGADITDGIYSIPFGAVDADYGITPGLRFERIQFRFELDDDASDPFVWEGFVFSHVRTVPASMTYTMDVIGLHAHAGYSPEDTRTFLHELVEDGLFIPVVIRGTTRRCFVSQVTGSVMTGTDERFQGRLSLVEVPLSLGQ